jgi:tetratricopeptide (TPR) repeat protein
MISQAEVHKFKSEYIEAHSIHIRVLQKASEDHDLYTSSLALINIAEIDVSIHAPKDNVQRNYDTARNWFNTMGLMREVTMCDLALADLHLREGNILGAKDLFERCMKSSLRYSEVISYCLERLGDTSRWGVSDGTSDWTTVFLVHSLKSKENLGIHKALQFLGDIFLAQDDEQTAITLFTVALEGFTYMDVHCSRAECLLRLGDISKGHGNLLKAMELWETAQPLFERSSQAKKVKQVYERLARVSEDVLEQHNKNLAYLAELNVPSVTVQDMNDLSKIQDMKGLDVDGEKELDLVAV